MIAPFALLSGLRRVALVALAEMPLVIILVVIIPGIAIQPFLPGGFGRLQALFKIVNLSVNNVLASTAEQVGAPKSIRRGRSARP